MLRLMIAAACKAVHVGEPPMGQRLPRIERGRLREQRPVAFDDVNLRVKTYDDPRGQHGWRGKGFDGVAAQLVRPKDATALRIGQLDRSKVSLGVAPQMAGGDILRIHEGSRDCGRWLRNEKAVPLAMMLILRSFAKPKIMSLVTASATATSSGVADVNGITRIVGPRGRAACWPDGASRWATSTKLILAGLETDRCAAAKPDLSDVASMPSF